MVDLEDPVQPLATPSRTPVEPAVPLDATLGPTEPTTSLDISVKWMARESGRPVDVTSDATEETWRVPPSIGVSN